MSRRSTDVEAFLLARERNGRSIVRAIVALNALLLVASLFVSLSSGSGGFADLVMTLIWLFVFAMLYTGRSWAKWLFVVASVISGVACLGLLFSLLPIITTAPSPVVLALALNAAGVVVMILSSLLLLFSESVKDFLYRQETSD